MAEKGKNRKPRLSPEQKEQKRKEKEAARKRIQIDLEQVEKLGMLMCTLEECSAFLDVKRTTLEKRQDFLDAWRKGKEKGKMSLRRHQFHQAEKSAAMAIWLGKQYLGQTDKQSLEHSGEMKINWMEEKTYSKKTDEENTE